MEHVKDVQDQKINTSNRYTWEECCQLFNPQTKVWTLTNNKIKNDVKTLIDNIPDEGSYFLDTDSGHVYLYHRPHFIRSCAYCFQPCVGNSRHCKKHIRKDIPGVRKYCVTQHKWCEPEHKPCQSDICVVDGVKFQWQVKCDSRGKGVWKMCCKYCNTVATYLDYCSMHVPSYEKGKNTSLSCCHFMDLMELTHQTYIRHMHFHVTEDHINCISKEAKLLDRFRVDGLSENNVVYEFLGSYYHGNPVLNHPEKPLFKSNKITAAIVYKNTFIRLYKILRGGFNLVFIWEDDFGKDFRLYHEVNQLVLEEDCCLTLDKWDHHLNMIIERWKSLMTTKVIGGIPVIQACDVGEKLDIYKNPFKYRSQYKVNVYS